MHKILLIDSDSVSAKKIASALIKSGFEVIIASSEAEGLKLVDDVSPDTVVVSDNTSQLHGSKLCRRIRHLFDLPIMLLGDKPEGEVYLSTLKGGTDWDYYMRLPISYGELAARKKVRY
jgi:DNA-binding response OmpR family regulator